MTQKLYRRLYRADFPFRASPRSLPPPSRAQRCNPMHVFAAFTENRGSFHPSSTEPVGPNHLPAQGPQSRHFRTSDHCFNVPFGSLWSQPADGG